MVSSEEQYLPLRVYQESDSHSVELRMLGDAPRIIIRDKMSDNDFVLDDYQITDPTGIHPAHPIHQSDGVFIMSGESSHPYYQMSQGRYRLIPCENVAPVGFAESLLFNDTYQTSVDELTTFSSWRIRLAYYLVARQYPICSEVQVFTLHDRKSLIGGAYQPPSPGYPYGIFRVDSPNEYRDKQGILFLQKRLNLPENVQMASGSFQLFIFFHEMGHFLLLYEQWVKSGPTVSFSDFAHRQVAQTLSDTATALSSLTPFPPTEILGYLNQHSFRETSVIKKWFRERIKQCEGLPKILDEFNRHMEVAQDCIMDTPAEVGANAFAIEQLLKNRQLLELF